MRASSIYPGGPDRNPDSPLTDGAEVREARRQLEGLHDLARAVYGPFGPEQFDSYEDYAARDAELWGDDPFGED